MLSGKAILATPMVAGMLFGQLCDGLATMWGIDWFGYAEKHPVSDAVIQYGNSYKELEAIRNIESPWYKYYNRKNSSGISLKELLKFSRKLIAKS